MKSKRNLMQFCLLCALVLAGFAAKAQPVITQQPTNQAVVVGGTVTFNVSVSGTGPFYYQWLCNGSILPSANPIITTVAGNGTNNYSGDGGAATNAELGRPAGIALDSTGNLLIADYDNFCIRKLWTNGIITTVIRGLSYPSCVAVDSSGNLFIGDFVNSCILKVGTNGIITTVAGNGTEGYSGDGGAATNAELYFPYSVAVDSSGNLFIADESNRIRKVGTNGVITTVVGNGINGYSGDGGAATNAELYASDGVSVDSSGNLLIADTGNNCIRKVGTNGIITTVAGGLFYPKCVAVDSSGNLFIADDSNRILKVGTNGIITTVAGNGTGGYSGDGGAATSAELYSPTGVTIDSAGNILIADNGNNRIRKVWSNVSPVPALTLSNVTLGDSGNYYQVIITGSGGSVTSSVVTLTVVLLSITQPPQCQTVSFSNNASFSVSTIGATPMSYQWYFSNTNMQSPAGGYAQVYRPFIYGAVVTNGGSGYTTIPQVQFIGGGGSGAGGYAEVSNGVVMDIVVTNTGNDYTDVPTLQIDPPNGLLIGQTNATLNLKGINANNVGNYFVVITNIYISVTSSPASLVMVPAIIQQPQGTAVQAGDAAVFSVVAADSDLLSYQWYFNGNPIGGATGTNLVVSPVGDAQAGSYFVVVASTSGSVTSSVVQLTELPFLVQQPQNTTVAPGSQASFSVVVGGTPPLGYQWYFNSNAISGQTATNLSLVNAGVTNVGAYFVIVTNYGGSVTSSIATLSLLPNITQQPQSQSVTQFNNATFSVAATAQTSLGYQWYFSNSPLSWQTNASLNLTNITTGNAGNYFVVVSAASGSVTSSVATLTVLTAPSIVQQPQSLNVVKGSNGTFIVSASGTTNLVYQWWMVSGTQSNATAVPVVINGFVLGANVTSGGAGYLAAPNVQILGGSGSGAGGYATVSNEMVSAITMTNAGSGYTTPPTIQIAAPCAISLPGQTNATLMLLSITNGNAANYFVVVTNSFGSVTSAVATLTVFLPPQNFFANAVIGNQLTLQFAGTPNYPYILQSATNLTPPVNWQSVLTNLADTNGNWSFTVSNLSAPSLFYRAMGQ